MIRASALVLALGVLVPGVALAAPPTTAGHASSSHGVGHSLSAQAYRDAVKVINRSFADAITGATKKMRLALAAARTPGQRSTARAKFRLAVAEATAARDAALVALGPPPAKG